MKETNLSSEEFVRDRILAEEELAVSVKGNRSTSRTKTSISFRWPGTGVLKLIPVDSDLSRFDRLSVSVFNECRDPIMVGLKLVHGPSKRCPDGQAVSFTGGREILAPGQRETLKFPQESFGSYDAPDGWNDIREIQVAFSRDKTAATAKIQGVLHGLRGESREIPSGPRLTHRGLAAVTSGGISAELSEESTMGGQRLEHGIGRPFTADNPAIYIPAPHPYPKETGDEILQGYIMGQRLDNNFPWDIDPLGRQEWRHFLHRHHFLRALLVAISETGGSCYGNVLRSIISSWVRANPVPLESDGGSGPSWETLSAAWRLREWFWVCGVAWVESGFDPSTRLDMLRSIWEHARSLSDHQGHPNNWIMVESAALALVGLHFPEFNEAETWLELGLERLRRHFRKQFLEDGVYFEISPLYHSICLHAMLEVRETALEKDRKLPDEFEKPLENCTYYLDALCRPDFSWPSINDSGGIHQDFSVLLRKAGEMLRRDDLVWTGSRGRSGKPREPGLRVFPRAGIVTMRSGHDRYANFLVFRAGPPGAAHFHEDVLSLDVTALGHTRLADPGITTYAPDKLTTHYRSPQAHTMPLLHGQGPSYLAMPFEDRLWFDSGRFHWISADGLDIAVGVFRGPWSKSQISGTLARTIIFVRGQYWIIRDVAFGAGFDEVSVNWQFAQGRVEVDRCKGITRLTDANGSNFEIIPLLGTKNFKVRTFAGSHHPCAGWISMHGEDIPATCCFYTIEGKSPIEMIWLLAPSHGISEERITGNRMDRLNGKTELEIHHSGYCCDVFSLFFPDSKKPPANAKDLVGLMGFTRTQVRK